jgi:hypothetical protein
MRRAGELPMRMPRSSALSQRHRLKRNWVTRDKTLTATPQLQLWSFAFLRVRITAYIAKKHHDWERDSNDKFPLRAARLTSFLSFDLELRCFGD